MSICSDVGPPGQASVKQGVRNRRDIISLEGLGVSADRLPRRGHKRAIQIRQEGAGQYGGAAD